MQAMNKVLAADPETKDRYEKATNGGKEWFSFSRWATEDMARWNNAEAVEYRDTLAAWLVSTDITYVLQYETNPDVVAYLKKKLIAAVEREKRPFRVDALGHAVQQAVAAGGVQDGKFDRRRAAVDHQYYRKFSHVVLRVA